MSSRIVIRGGCVLTMGAKTPNFAEADVLIEDGRVRDVGQGLRHRDAEVIDATDTVVMPGFIDAHRHTWQTLLRNLGSPPASMETVGEAHNPDDIYAATLVGLLSAAQAGITTLVDWADIPRGDDFADAALQAHSDSGIRTVFVASPPEWAGSSELEAQDLKRITQRIADGNGLTTAAFGSGRSVGIGSLADIASDWSMARELGLHIHAHAGRSAADEGAIAALAQKDLLGGDVTLIHCSYASGEDLDAIAASGTSVVLTPSTEMTDGMGAPPIQALIDRKIRPGLGVDTDREAPGDILAQMRATISLQHATYFDLRLAGKAGLPNLMTTREVIRHGTVDGARSVGLADVTGSLEPGRFADIVVLRTDRPNIIPINDPIGAVVWGMDTSNVDSVLVGGQPILRNGALTADVANLRRLATKAQERVASAAGLLVDSNGSGM